jgi:HSP20 family molecular chaperone IbpA
VSRKIQLPEDADLDSVTTDFTFGVLNVTFAKKAESTTLRRKLQIL